MNEGDKALSPNGGEHRVKRTSRSPSKPSNGASRTPILFIAEAVTLAQVTRLAVLARALEQDGRYQAHFASAAFDPLIFREGEFIRWPIHSLSKELVEAKITSGKRIYDSRILERYVAEELALFARVRPAMVVGDLRWSLTVSAAIAKVPCATLINAYWSPHLLRRGFPLPEHPIVRLLGVEKAQHYFPQAIPYVFAHFARPVNALRKKHRLPEIGSLLEVITHGDVTLYPDVEAITPTSALPESHHFLGPVLWAPEGPQPIFPNPNPQNNRPRIYVTLGSSGNIECLPMVIAALGQLDVDAIVATAGRATRNKLPLKVANNVRITDYVPGHLAARASQLVICNGGSSTAYQALNEGTPVLGIPHNLDQYLAMTAIRDTGAGLLLRSGTLTVQQVKDAVVAMINDKRYALAAGSLKQSLHSLDARDRFRGIVSDIVHGKAAVSSTGLAE
ncbi:MAG: glycosyltransferase [Polyangiales bacterium]